MPNPWDYAGKANATEHAHQTALFMWANMAVQFGLKAADCKDAYSVAGLAQAWAHEWRDQLPQLKWLHAIKNQGHGDRVRGNQSAAEGVKAGVSDIFLPFPMDCKEGSGIYTGNGYATYCGLYIEMKRPERRNHKDGGMSKEQLDFQAYVRQQGYACEPAYGWQHARDIILKYLGRG